MIFCTACVVLIDIPFNARVLRRRGNIRIGTWHRVSSMLTVVRKLCVGCIAFTFYMVPESKQNFLVRIKTICVLMIFVKEIDFQQKYIDLDLSNKF